MINFACRHYKAAKPCVFNKQEGSECPTCEHASTFGERILFIKLDAIGDVLRSASLLPAIIARHVSPYIAWLTKREAVELVEMMALVDEVIELSEVGICRVLSGGWDYVYSLSNDLPSASIATLASPLKHPIGFYVQNGVVRPSNIEAEHWLQMAAFDRLKRLNKESYQRRMLAIIGDTSMAISTPFLKIGTNEQKKAIDRVYALFKDTTHRRVAVNIGAGGRWPKKMLNPEQIYQYCERLILRNEVNVLLVGGSAEVEKANAIMALDTTGGRIKAALTSSSIHQFVALLDQVDVLLCGDTLALHIATSIGLPTVAVFGPTSAPEIEDFGGLILKTWTTHLDCLACYGDCDKRNNCMSLLDLEYLVCLTEKQLSRRRRELMKSYQKVSDV
jgi:ADP-heptose:LPS heptosyltransferase